MDLEDVSNAAATRGYHQPLYTNKIESPDSSQGLVLNQSVLEVGSGDVILSTEGSPSVVSTGTLTFENPIELSSGTDATGITKAVTNSNNTIPTGGAVVGHVAAEQQDLGFTGSSPTSNFATHTVTITDGSDATIQDYYVLDDQTLSTTADVSGTDDQVSISESGSSVTIDDDFAADDQGLTYVNDNAPTGSSVTHSVNIDSGSNVDIRDYYDPNTDDQKLQSTSRNGATVTIPIENGGSTSFTDNYDPDTTIPDDQNLYTVTDPVNGGLTRIGIDDGSSATFTDDFEANTDSQNLGFSEDFRSGLSEARHEVSISGGSDTTITDYYEQDTTVTYNDGDGISIDFTDDINVDSPYCDGAGSKLLWDGNSFKCGTDQKGINTGSNESINQLSVDSSSTDDVIELDTTKGLYTATIDDDGGVGGDGYLPDNPPSSYVDMSGEAIANLPSPTSFAATDDWAATKGYVDSQVGPTLSDGSGIFIDGSDDINVDAAAVCDDPSDKLLWDGSRFTCGTDSNTGGGDTVTDFTVDSTNTDDQLTIQTDAGSYSVTIDDDGGVGGDGYIGDSTSHTAGGNLNMDGYEVNALGSIDFDQNNDDIYMPSGNADVTGISEFVTSISGSGNDYAVPTTEAVMESMPPGGSDDQNLQGFSRNGNNVTLDLENGGSASFTDQTGSGGDGVVNSLSVDSSTKDDEILIGTTSGNTFSASITDNDTTYTGGAGLLLSGSQFQVDSPSCSGNEVLDWSASNGFQCKEVNAGSGLTQSGLTLNVEDGPGVNVGSDQVSLTAAGETCGPGGYVKGFTEGGALDCGTGETWYKDEDGDDWGGPSQVSPTRPSGPWYKASELTGVNDCDDGDDRVYPGQDQYFGEPYNGDEWDYDCDTDIDKLFTNANPSCGTYPACNDGNAGWEGSVADCGATETWKSVICTAVDASDEGDLCTPSGDCVCSQTGSDTEQLEQLCK